MDRLLTAERPVADDDAPPRSPSSRTPDGSQTPSAQPRAPMHPVWRTVVGVVIGAATMFGVATLDTVAGATVPVLGSFAALPAGPDEPEIVEVPAPPSTPGSCLNWDRPDAADATIVDCAQPHLFEQAGTVALTDQGDLPSDATWRQLVSERCTPVVLTYLGNVFDPDGRYRVGALKPSGAKWAQGDRELRCGLQSSSRSGALYPMTGRVAEGDQSPVQEAGTCLGIDGRTIADPVSCTGPHAVEAVGVVDIGGRFPEAYPQVGDQDAFLQPECGRIAAEYAGGAEAIAAKGLTVYWDNLSEESWAAGSRKVNCNLAALLPDRSGFAPVTGTVRGDVVVGSEAAPPASGPGAGEPAPPTGEPAPSPTPGPTDGTAPSEEAPPPSSAPAGPEEPVVVDPALPIPADGGA